MTQKAEKFVFMDLLAKEVIKKQYSPPKLYAICRAEIKFQQLKNKTFTKEKASIFFFNRLFIKIVLINEMDATITFIPIFVLVGLFSLKNGKI